MEKLQARRNTNNSVTYEVLSQPKVTPFNYGEKCGILSNHNHPKLTIAGCEELQKVDVSLAHHVSELRKLRHAMAGLNFETREFDLALNFLFGHQHLIWETLNRSFNQRAAAYATSKNAGVRHG